MQNRLTTFKNILPLVILCTSALGFAYYAEFQLNLKPCPLCLYQRYGFMVASGFAVMGLFFKSISKPSLFKVICLVFVINSCIAGYQVLIEHKIVAPSVVCRKDVFKTQSVEELRVHLQKNSEHAACDKIVWNFLGWSMAEYNCIFCLLLAIYSFVQRNNNIRKKSIHSMGF